MLLKVQYCYSDIIHDILENYFYIYYSLNIQCNQEKQIFLRSIVKVYLQ